tara:strand:+ start:1161 stop:1994 length:834 start_codon:yes stop_codon:yes gene_type:complete
MKKMIIPLLVLSSVAHSDEYDALLESSQAIVDQITQGILLVGAATEYSHHGDALTEGNLSSTAHITSEQLQAYNNALYGMETYLPYGDLQEVLEVKAMDELELMDDAIDTFTEVVVDMIQVVEVAEKSAEASSPQEEAEVQEFVTANVEVLTIEQEEVDTYNQAVDDIETHANNASAFLAVAGNEEAVEFLEQSIENANTTAEQTNIFYNANQQWVSMGYNTTRNMTAVYLNGDNFGLDLYVTEADILAAGSETEFFQTSPVALGYECFMNQTDCEI